MQKQLVCPSCSSLQEYNDEHLPNNALYEVTCHVCHTRIKRKKIPLFIAVPTNSIVCAQCHQTILYDEDCLPANTKFELLCNECGFKNIIKCTQEDKK